MNNFFFLMKIQTNIHFTINKSLTNEKTQNNLRRPLLIITLYYQTKTSIIFWCKQGLNLRSLIQPLETLSV